MQSKFTTLKCNKDTWTSDPAVHKVHSSGSFVQNLHLWTVCPKDRSTILDLSWNIWISDPATYKRSTVNIWTSEPRAAEKRSTILDLNIYTSEPCVGKKGPQFWMLCGISWTSEPCAREKGPQLWIFCKISGPLTQWLTKKVHNFGCFVKYLGVQTTTFRKRSKILYFFKKAEPLSHAA